MSKSKKNTPAVEPPTPAEVAPPAIPQLSVAAQAIKDREDQGGTVLRWRDEDGKIKADGLAVDAGVIVKRLYIVEVREQKEVFRETSIKDALDDMDRLEREHAVAAFHKIPNLVEEAEHSLDVRKEAKKRSHYLNRLEDATSEMKSAKKALEVFDEQAMAKAAAECMPPLWKPSKPADAQPEAKPTTEQPAPVNEAWREVSIEELLTLKAPKSTKAPKGAISKLQEKGFETLGKLHDHMEKSGQWWAKNLSCGIGAEKAQQISQSLADWFFENPKFAPSPKDANACEGCGKPKATEINGIPFCAKCAEVRKDDATPVDGEKAPGADDENPFDNMPEGAHVIVDGDTTMINPEEGEGDTFNDEDLTGKDLDDPG